MDHATLIKLMRESDFLSNTKKSFREKYNVSLKTINKYLIKYDITHRRNLNILNINRDKNGRFILVFLKNPKIKFYYVVMILHSIKKKNHKVLEQEKYVLIQIII